MPIARKLTTLLDFVRSRRLWDVDEDGWVALSLFKQALAFLMTATSARSQRQFPAEPKRFRASRKEPQEKSQRPSGRLTSFSSSLSSAMSSSLDAPRGRTFEGEAGVLSSSTGSALMLAAETMKSGFSVRMGEITS